MSPTERAQSDTSSRMKTRLAEVERQLGRQLTANESILMELWYELSTKRNSGAHTDRVLCREDTHTTNHYR